MYANVNSLVQQRANIILSTNCVLIIIKNYVDNRQKQNNICHWIQGPNMGMEKMVKDKTTENLQKIVW